VDTVITSQISFKQIQTNVRKQRGGAGAGGARVSEAVSKGKGRGCRDVSHNSALLHATAQGGRSAAAEAARGSASPLPAKEKQGAA